MLNHIYTTPPAPPSSVKIVPLLFVAASLLAALIMPSFAMAQKPPLLVERTAVKSTTPPPHLPAWSTKGISPRVKTALSRNADSALSNAALSIEPLEISSTRSRWLLPVVGAVIGAGAGAVWGTYLMNDADEWIAPPAHLVTIPIGAAAGALVGWVADQVVRR